MQCKTVSRLALPTVAAMANVMSWWKYSADQPFGPLNRCRNGECGELVEMFCRFQHYCCTCAGSNLGLRNGEPALRITMALRLRRRLVSRLLHQHLAQLPPCVAKHILDFLMNDLGKLPVSMRWACILLRSGVQLDWQKVVL